MRFISTSGAPSPAGHYSQAVESNGLVYVSGQLPIDPLSGRHIVGTIEEQAAQALRNLAVVLEAGGSSMERVVRTNVYIADISLWPQVNAVYARAFGQHRPARSVVPTQALHYGFLIEIDAIGALVP